MQYKILNEQPWQILSNAMTISPSSTGYDLQVSANGKDYTTMFHVNEGVTRQVTNLSSGSYYRMLGNEGEVVVNWVRDCSGGGSGGGSGSGATYTAGEYIEIQNDVISVTGITPDEYLTSADTQDLASQAYVDAAVTAATQNMATEAYVDAAVTGATQGMATQQDIQTAIAAETARTENTYAKPADIPSLAGYATEAFVTGITDTIEDHLDDVERVTATAYTELHQDIVTLSGATSGMATAQDIQTAIASETARTENTYAKESELGNYYTTAQTYNRTEIDQKIASGGTFDPTLYYTKAEVDAEITGATQDMVTADDLTGYTSMSDFEDFQQAMMDKEEVVASALTELQSSIPDMSDYYTKDEVDAEVTGATQGFATQAYVTAATQGMATQAYVTGITSPMQTQINNKVTNGGGISTIQKISQADYNDLVSGGTVDSYTFYVITGSTS